MKNVTCIKIYRLGANRVEQYISPKIYMYRCNTMVNTRILHILIGDYRITISPPENSEIILAHG